MTLLVFDLPYMVKIVNPDHAKRWGKTHEELFALGLKNVQKKYPSKVQAVKLANEFPCTLVVGDHFFVATSCLHLDRIPGATGKFGALFIIPNRHTMLSHSIEKKGPDLAKAASNMVPVARRLYQQGPGSITPNLYWYHEGTYTLIPHELKDGHLSLMPPEAFSKLLGQK